MSAPVPGTFWRDAEGLHVDTRGLAPPDPMIAVLWHIAQPGETGPVIALFDRDPLFLLSELEDRGWRHAYEPAQPGQVRLVLRPAP